MVFIEVDGADQHVSTFDVETKLVERLFTADPNGFISHMAISPSESQLLLAYAAPPQEGEIQFGYTSLFLIRLSDPQQLIPLTARTLDGESFLNPVWSPDESIIIYTHVSPSANNPTQFEIRMESLSLETRETAVVAENAIWPRFSPSGDRLVYVTVDPDSLGNGLWLAAPDGTNALALVTPDQFTVVDVPMFSPDGAFVYFTASENEQSKRHWWEILFAVNTAAAHNIPSDWYRIPTQGGEPKRLTTIEEVGIYGAFAPNGESIGFATFNGLYTMRPNGADVTRVLTRNATSSFAWIGSKDEN